MIKRVGILTGGGDVPGLNALIKAVVGRLERVGESARRVDVDRFYDVAEYRPKVTDVWGLPMFHQ